MKKSRYSLLPLVAALLLGCGTGGTVNNPGASDERPTANQDTVAHDATKVDEKTLGTQTEPVTQPEREPTAEERAIAALQSFDAFVQKDDGGIAVVMPEQTTDDDLALLADLDDLRTLSLGGTQVTDAGLDAVSRHPRIEGLYLYDTNIGDAGLAHLKDLTQLRELSLAWTDVTDEGLQSLQEMKQLTELDVAWTSVSDQGLAHLDGLKNLQAIVTRGSDVTDEGFALLQQAIPDLRQAEEDTVARAPETPAPLDLDAIEANQEAESTVIGRPAPEIDGEDIDGVAFKLSDYRGKVVLLDFWGHW